MRITIKTAAAVAAVLASGGALASPIQYDLTGIATGTIGNTNFTDASIDITVVGDTSDVTNPSNFLYMLNVDAGVAQISIGGVGSGTISEASDVFDYQGNSTAGFSVNSLDRDDLKGYSAFSSYNLTTFLGPVGGGSDFSSALGQFNNVGTSLGLLSVSALDDNFFTAAAPTPEPIAFGLLGFSVFGLIARRRARRVRQGS